VSGDAVAAAEQLAEQLRAPDLRFALAFFDWRLDAKLFATTLHRALGAPVVGCSTVGVITREPGAKAAGLALCGDWVRVGVGVAPDLAKSVRLR
jgi:hypothetical protein